MKEQELLRWFDEIAAVKLEGVVSRFGLVTDAMKWVADAGSAISAAFPPSHEIVRRWEAVGNINAANTYNRAAEQLQNYQGIFKSAHDQLRNGRLSSFVDAVRAQAEDDLLDQAAWVLDEGLNVAATVLAGGALEVHLRRLCEKNQLTIQGHGTIEKYNGAIGEARNRGTIIYEKPDGSAVTSWAQSRNDAAHQPDEYRRTRDEVRLMIDGIRNFIARIQ